MKNGESNFTVPKTKYKFGPLNLNINAFIQFPKWKIFGIKGIYNPVVEDKSFNSLMLSY